MPKGIREPYQELEGGKGFGGMGGGGVRIPRYKISEKPRVDPAAEQEKLTAGLLGAGAPVAAGLSYAMSEEAPRRRAEAERKEKAEREAAAELKRESRGMKSGGTASSRADGCAQRGKTRGKMV